jgi:hypothetical protein
MVHQRATHRVLPLLVVAVLIVVGFAAMGGRAEAASASYAVGAGHSSAACRLPRAPPGGRTATRGRPLLFFFGRTGRWSQIWHE